MARIQTEARTEFANTAAAWEGLSMLDVARWVSGASPAEAETILLRIPGTGRCCATTGRSLR